MDGELETVSPYMDSQLETVSPCMDGPLETTKGVVCSQGSGDKFSRPYRTSPDQLVSVGRSAGLAGGKAAADKSTSSAGASSSGAAANGKAGGLTSNLNAASGGKFSTSSLPRR